MLNTLYNFFPTLCPVHIFIIWYQRKLKNRINRSLFIGLLLRVNLISDLTKEKFAVVKPPFFFSLILLFSPVISYIIRPLGGRKF